jgi:tripartite-type tricarboxylate transporter receptor subunit TctC
MKKFATLGLALLGAAFAHAQSFPIKDKPISIIVPFAAGGPTDRVARDLAEAMRKQIPGSNFVVDNVAGAGGTIGATKAARATPDGHTLMVFHIGMATTPLMYRKLSYKPLDDFEYLGIINDVPMTLVGKPQLAANTYRDFENHIRNNAGKINIAHAGQGSASHLCGLMWQYAIKLNTAATTVPYKGTGPAMTALMGGEVDAMCDQTTNTVTQIESGRIKAFAVTTAKPLSDHKTLQHYPSLNDMGVKGFNLTIWHGLYAPKGTPAHATKALNDALARALKDPDFIKRQQGLGAVVANDGRITPDGHKKFVAAEIAKLKPVIEAAKAFAD